MQTTIQIILCPHCDREIERVVSHDGFQVGGTSIGPSAISCPECGLCYDSGKSEWDEKYFIAKVWILFTRFIWLLLSSFFIAGGFALAIRYFALRMKWIHPAQETICMIVSYCIGTLFLSYFFFRNIIREIHESRQRVASSDI